MRTAYIKPSSYTQVSASAFAKVVVEVCEAADITVNFRNKVLFETGCAFVEQYIRDIDFGRHLLENHYSGFWAWWTVEFLRDDEMQIRYKPRVFRHYPYADIKRLMLDDTSVYDAFARFLQPIDKPRFYGKI